MNDQGESHYFKDLVTAGFAKDSHGAILNYDGTTDCVLYFEDFDAFCQLVGLGGVVSRDNFAEPAYPAEAYTRTAAGLPTERDAETIRTYTSDMVKYLEKCTQTSRLMKFSLRLQSNLIFGLIKMIIS